MRNKNVSFSFKEKIIGKRAIFKSGAMSILFYFSTFFFTNCENFITGYGPQPRYLENRSFKPMLNILGVLRPDTLEGLPQSFVHLEKSYPFNESPDSTLITDAQVTIYKYEGIVIVDSVRLTYRNNHPFFPGNEYRDSTFFPEADVSYGISCIREDFPALTGFTCVPPIPAIVENSMRFTAEQLSFTIERHSATALYDIYFLVGDRTYQTRTRRPETGNTEVVLDLDLLPTGEGELLVYGYDLNLSEYITYNISIKPNTYRASYSTVNDGYGCFGSLNVFKKTLSF